jgi:tyrosine-protein phosphatase
MEEEDQEPNFDVPQSREEKPAAYPNGPICIYEAGVYLYFEPTAEQACTFDVIINVASEVKNPFSSTVPESQKDIDARRVDGPPAESVDFGALPPRAKPASFGMDDASPTTPKATPLMQTTQPGELVIDGKMYKTPEYIHMPWEHNTDIVPDLYKLVKIMDERVQQGKRVLIHCQCGVSRSASLIVAYGLYKDPQMSVQDAYDGAKKRSRWIGPNMNLIMQLQEFRNGLLRANDSRSYSNQGFGRRSAGLNTTRSTGTSRYSPYERENASGSRTPRTAPLPPEQRASTGDIMAISPGPLSAPSGAFSTGFRRSWDASQSHFELPSQPALEPTPYVDPAGHVVPVLAVPRNDRSLAPVEPAPTNTDTTTLTIPTVSAQYLFCVSLERFTPLSFYKSRSEAVWIVSRYPTYGVVWDDSLYGLC